MELHLASVWESIADALKDEPALVHGDRVISWQTFDERAARLAAGLRALGVGEGAPVAIDLYNCSEYFESFAAIFKAGGIPTNVNYRYRAQELRHLLDDAEAEVVIAHRSLATRVREVQHELPSLRALLEVDELGSSDSSYEQAIAQHEPLPRARREATGLFLSYTGGTTGQPKGVMYAMEGLTARSLRTRGQICGVAIPDGSEPADAALSLRDRGERPIVIPASPLMHSTAFTFASLPGLCAGGTIVTIPQPRFDPHALLETIERRRATVTAIVGDAFGRPIVQALDERARAGKPYDLSSIRILCSAGVAFGADTKRRLLEHAPRLTILDACGSTEGAAYGFSVVRAGDPLSANRFMPAPGTFVLAEDGESRAPDGEVGLLASLRETTGYHGHPEETARIFRTLNGQPYVVPGDFGRMEPDGSITLLGRGSTTINTGGEKVFPEEVEEVLKTAPGIIDAVVLGLPDERLGQVVAALVQADGEARTTDVQLVDLVRERLAGYKVPRVVQRVDRVPRAPNGKIDLAAARALAESPSGDSASPRATRSGPLDPSRHQADT